MDVPASGERHSVWGRVVDQDGQAVPNSEIFWVDPAREGEPTVGLFDVHKVAQADGDGRFWAPGLPAGPSLLVADFERMGVVADKVKVAHAARIVVPTEIEPELTFPHRRTDFGRIAGVVKDEIDGRPATRLPIALFVEGETEKPLRQVATSTSGAFDFPWLHAGQYRLAIWGTVRQLEGNSPVELKRNQRINVKVGLHRRPPGPRCAVRVRVERGLGLPLGGASVQVVVPNVHVAPKTTDESGHVEFTNLPARPAQIVATAPHHSMSGVNVAPGPIDEPLDVQVVLEPTSRIRVEIVDSATGAPLRHANLLVSHGGGDKWVWGGVLPPPDAPPRNHHDVEVRPGPVTARAASPGYTSAELRFDVPRDDDDTKVTLRLDPR